MNQNYFKILRIKLNFKNLFQTSNPDADKEINY